MRFANHVKWRGEKFGAVVFDTLREKVYVTNETGGRILPLVQQGLAPEDIVGALRADYRGQQAQMRADVTEFLARLRAAGLVTAGRGEEGTR